MSEAFIIDSARFITEFRARLLRSKSSLAKTVNRVGFALAEKAIKYTPKADRSEIEKLGLSGYQVFSKAKAGKRLKTPKPIYVVMRQMRNIYIGKLYKEKGAAAVQEFLRQSKADKDMQILKVLKGRLKAISYLKSGWVPVRNTLARALGSARGGFDPTKAGRTKGKAIPAQEGWNPTAILENFTQPQGARAGIAHAKLRAGFQRAVNEEADSMANHAKGIIEKEFAP